jgi:Protein of unknown function (DUF3592)
VRLGTFLIGCGFLLVGVAQLGGATSDSLGAAAAERWPTTSGTVLSSSVQIADARGGHAYTPKVTYSYTVGDRNYVGNRISTQEYSDLSERASATAARYLVENPVTVHYDPFTPQHSLLEPGLSIFSYLWFGLAVLAILVGAVLAVVGIRTGPRRVVT